jgi:hypothetical protein
MPLPQAPANLQTERAGILAVASELNRLGLIWRETPMADVGIDGQIELVDDLGSATGQLLAAQVKSGASYFRAGDEEYEWRFHPSAKHRVYWERFPLPVLLFLHSPDDRRTYWVDARQALRSPERSVLSHIGVPKRNLLQGFSRKAFLQAVGASTAVPLPLEDVLVALAESASVNPAFPVSYLDLFTIGLTNIGRSIYYGMDLPVEVAESRLEDRDDEMGLCCGEDDHEFLFGFVRFLVEQHLADVNIEDCMVDWAERGIEPRFVAPLTRRGRALVRLIHEWQEKLERDGVLSMPPYVSLAQETYVRMQFRAVHDERIRLVQSFRTHILNESPRTGASRDAKP